MVEPPAKHEESVLSDEQLAELERATEQGHETQHWNCGTASIDEFRRCYTLIESLASPVRDAVGENARPPSLTDYIDLEEIGRGGMGIVYRGLHRKTHRVDAIKVIRPDRLSATAGDRQRDTQHQLLREAQLAARVAHEHIVPVYQVGAVDGCRWFSMQLVAGPSLRDLMDDGPMLPEKAAKIIEQIARAVDKVHRHGVLHGDIKPHNILMESEGQRPLITDFGLADLMESTDVAMGIAGTPAYMAPELADAALQQQSPEQVAAARTIASDIYSLGATLWSLLTGMSPCEDNLNPGQQLHAVVSRELRVSDDGSDGPRDALMRICDRCMKADPEDRYATAGQLADALAEWLNRPRWNQFFPALRRQLQFVVAPVLGLGGFLVWWQLQVAVAEPWIWLTILSGYPPLFLVFSMSQTNSRPADRARRELWSVWTGHLAGTLACLISIRILCDPDSRLAFSLFYPVWAGLSSVAFFAQSGNFWSAYRWIGVAWTGMALLLSMVPDLSPLLFGAAAAMTCVLIARGDQAFDNRNDPTR